MADKKETEVKIYTIPLRREWLKVPKYKRAKKASKAIKEFLLRHLKIRDKNMKKIKFDPLMNEALWSRGIKRPPQKITVRVKKKDENFIVEFVSLPKKFKEEEKKLKKKQKKLEAIKKEKEERKKKKKEEVKKAEEKGKEEKKKEEEEKDKEKTVEEKKEEKEKKEKDKLLKKIKPTEKIQKLIKPTQAFGAKHRKALEK